MNLREPGDQLRIFDFHVDFGSASQFHVSPKGQEALSPLLRLILYRFLIRGTSYLNLRQQHPEVFWMQLVTA